MYMVSRDDLVIYIYSVIFYRNDKCKVTKS